LLSPYSRLYTLKILLLAVASIVTKGVSNLIKPAK